MRSEEEIRKRIAELEKRIERSRMLSNPSRFFEEIRTLRWVLDEEAGF